MGQEEVAGVEPSGVVSPRPTTAGVTVGEGTQPTALEEVRQDNIISLGEKRKQRIVEIEDAARAKWNAELFNEALQNQLGVLTDLHVKGIATNEDVNNFESVIDNSDDSMVAVAKISKLLAPLKKANRAAEQQRIETPAANEEITTETEGADLGTETTEAIEATQERQEAPAAGTVAGKRGPKPKPAEVKAQIRVSRNEQNRINNYAEDKRKKFVAQLQQTLTPEQIEELSFEEAEQAEIDARQSRRSALRGLVELQDNPNIARGSAVGKRISAAATSETLVGLVASTCGNRKSLIAPIAYIFARFFIVFHVLSYTSPDLFYNHLMVKYTKGQKRHMLNGVISMVLSGQRKKYHKNGWTKLQHKVFFDYSK